MDQGPSIVFVWKTNILIFNELFNSIVGISNSTGGQPHEHHLLTLNQQEPDRMT